MSYTYEIEIQESDSLKGRWHWQVNRSDGTVFHPRYMSASEEEARAKAEQFIDEGCTNIYTPPEPIKYPYVPKVTHKHTTYGEVEPEKPKKKWWQR